MAYGSSDFCFAMTSVGGSCREFRGLCVSGFCSRHCKTHCTETWHRRDEESKSAD